MLAESDNPEVVEGKRYFPGESVTRMYLRPRTTQTVCPWKGVAHCLLLRLTVHLAQPAGVRLVLQVRPTGQVIETVGEYINHLFARPNFAFFDSCA